MIILRMVRTTSTVCPTCSLHGALTGNLFNQVKNHSDDQVFHRFLWRTSDTEQPRVYQWLRLNFGDKPAPDIAAAATTRKQLKNSVYMSTLTTLGDPEKVKRNASRSQVKSTPFSRLDNSSQGVAFKQ